MLPNVRAAAPSVSVRDVVPTGASIRKLNVTEFLLLQETTPELKTNGQVYTKTKFIPLEDNLRFLAIMMKEVYGVDLQLGIGKSVWQDFQTALAIRNRITHPKSEEDFTISDTEIEAMKSARSWFCQIIADSVNGIQIFISKHQITKNKSERIQ